MADNLPEVTARYLQLAKTETAQPRSGFSALFVGSSDETVKAAEQVAAELNAPLYRIDLSAVVSKYTGETEKNLDRIFNDAANSNAVLLFDEADALFGERTDVKDSHDRYANTEIDYLLQRIEQYAGLAILATNADVNTDPAFARRFAITVELPKSTDADPKLRRKQA